MQAKLINILRKQTVATGDFPTIADALFKYHLEMCIGKQLTHKIAIDDNMLQPYYVTLNLPDKSITVSKPDNDNVNIITVAVVTPDGFIFPNKFSLVELDLLSALFGRYLAYTVEYKNTLYKS